jgi:hypothetical protein
VRVVVSQSVTVCVDRLSEQNAVMQACFRASLRSNNKQQRVDSHTYLLLVPTATATARHPALALRGRGVVCRSTLTTVRDGQRVLMTSMKGTSDGTALTVEATDAKHERTILSHTVLVSRVQRQPYSRRPVRSFTELATLNKCVRFRGSSDQGPKKNEIRSNITALVFPNSGAPELHQSLRHQDF